MRLNPVAAGNAQVGQVFNGIDLFNIIKDLLNVY
jgi:hypothetical protein